MTRERETGARRGWLPLLLLVALLPGRAAAETDPMQTLRFTVGLGGGYGYVSMERWNGYVAQLERAVSLTATDWEGGGDTNGAGTAGLLVRGYFPYFIAAEVGAWVLYANNEATGTWGIGAASGSETFEHHELGVEIPILVGGYYPFFDQLFLSALIGIDVLSPSMSLWDRSGDEDLDDYEADASAGFMLNLALDYMPVEHFALGLDLRYRYLVSDDVLWDTDDLRDGQPVRDGTGDTYQLDFSGVSFDITVKAAF